MSNRSLFHSVRTTIGPNRGTTKSATYYGVYFYPYTKPTDDPVFAVVGGPETIIARPHPTKGLEVIQYFLDDLRFNESLCTASWTKDLKTGDPLIAVGGQAGIIKILNVKTGKVTQTLSGHGDEIMEILTSPKSQKLLASASADSTVRIWSLDPAHARQPCALICAGEGHRETILSIAFHSSGRYLLSGGMDHIVNLWVLPDLPDESTGGDKPITLMYPHFSTSMIHSNYIDCLAFHGDYILSKAARESKIVLWAIQNFTSRLPPPARDKAPTTHEWRATRSAFGGGFDRLLQFSIPDTEPFFMRFGIFARARADTFLAMGSTSGRVHMWNLLRTEMCGKSPGDTGTRDGRDTTTPSEGGSPAVTSAELNTTGLIAGSDRGPSTAAAAPAAPSAKLPPIRGDALGDPLAVIKAHYTLEIPRVKTTIRHVAYSLSGEYMVCVGEGGNIVISRKDLTVKT
ncbi:WD40-repeat-containing domain protein [Tuber brumale]|nr:WD40-repeat-containing domain protein [Tuber brumale]